MTKRLMVIDGNSLMHRAYHGVQAPMSAPDGTPTNAVYGFMAIFLKFVEAVAPDAIVCAFDAGKPEFRLKAVEAYKANRKPMDDALRVQFPLMEDLLTALNIPIVKEKGWEGDDILGTVAARAELLDFETMLITGDKDAYQLVNEKTKVATTKKGMSEIVVYGPEEVFERYGVTPEQFIDFLALKGDSSDNIPGVPGIGDKSAATLLQKFSSIDGIYEHLDELKGKQRENIEAHKQDAYASQIAATISREVPFDLDLDAVSWPSFSPQVVTEAFSALRLSTQLKRVLEFSSDDTSEFLEQQQMQIAIKPTLVEADAHARLEQAIKEGTLCSVVMYEPEQLSLFDNEKTLFVGIDDSVAQFSAHELKDVLVRIVCEARWCARDVKEVFSFLYPADASEQAYLTYADMKNSTYFDISLAGYVLASHEKSYDIEHLVQHYMHVELPEAKDEEQQAYIHAQAILRLEPVLREHLERDEAQACYEDIEAPLVPVLVHMERMGAAIDIEILHAMDEENNTMIDALRTSIFAHAGKEFNVDSPKQLSEVLFEDLGLTHGKKKKSGYSTDAATLGKIRSEHPIVDEVIQYRELAKLHSTYLAALPKLRKGDGRIHTTFNQTIAATGRLSSSEPNLQNIPVRNDMGKRIRESFIPLAQDEVFVSADYSQIELRLLAHLSGDKGLIDAFCSGQDFHTQTAAQVFGMALDEVTPAMRSRAKAVNFGIVYGQQAFGLSQSLGIPFYEAREMIEDYFVAYPDVEAYLEDLKAQAYTDGYVSTLYGRRRYITEVKSTNQQMRAFGERTAMNHPMQGSAADIIKLAMISVQNKLEEAELHARLMIQVHDELDISCPVSELDEVVSLVKTAMQEVVELKVPLVADVVYGNNWAQAH